MKSDLMKYKGYSASIGYDKSDKIFIGEVFGIQDSLNFHGRSIDELEESFHNSIDNYLAVCEKIGKKPQKQYSGCFNVRTSSILHEKMSEFAAENNITLNQVVTMALESFIKKQTV
ncbi:MAG: type II toxin-antitoxin system HicB family antitoxin [Lachnospiraceae bacterium]|nr:type II toxin-antitoxin system HicB family antitoxin [Lachnospiraceae bacterium]